MATRETCYRNIMLDISLRWQPMTSSSEYFYFCLWTTKYMCHSVAYHSILYAACCIMLHVLSLSLVALIKKVPTSTSRQTLKLVLHTVMSVSWTSFGIHSFIYSWSLSLKDATLMLLCLVHLDVIFVYLLLSFSCISSVFGLMLFKCQQHLIKYS